MFCQSFPDLAWLKNQAETRFSNRKDWNNNALKHAGWPTVILNVKAGETYRDNIPGPLSFFTTLSGKSEVEVNGKKTVIPENCFLLTNAGERYTLEINKKQPAETFNIHFSEHWAEDALTSFAKPETLIDNPKPSGEVVFRNKLYVKSEPLKKILFTLRDTKDEGSLKHDELLFQLVVGFLEEQELIQEKTKLLPVIRKSTREEIAKRLFLATDYIYAFSEKNITLEELATVSCLSKFHFLRLFKQFYQQTPHQFVTSLRIQKSKDLIRTGNAEIRTIAAQLGFDSASSFSRLFQQHVGMYPRQYRDTL